MAVYRELINENLVIIEDSSISGQVHGSVTVMEHKNLQLHGVIIGTLNIMKNAEVFIHGRIKGNIVNSGMLYVFGMVEGSILTNVTGKTVISDRATISEI